MTGEELLFDMLKKRIETELQNRVGQSITIDLGLRLNDHDRERVRAWLREEHTARRVRFRPPKVTISF